MNDSTNNEGNSVVAALAIGLIFAAGAACGSLGRDGDGALISSQQLLETKALVLGKQL